MDSPDSAASIPTRSAAAGAPAEAPQLRGATTGPGAAGLAPLPLDETGHPLLPPILKTVAETGEGCAELVDAIVAHRERIASTGELEARRVEGSRAQMRSLMAFRLIDALEGSEGAALEDELSRAVAARDMDAYEAADRLFASIMKGGTT